MYIVRPTVMIAILLKTIAAIGYEDKYPDINEILPYEMEELKNENSFFVTHHFYFPPETGSPAAKLFEKDMVKKLEAEMIKGLEEIGVVFARDHESLSTEQLLQKDKAWDNLLNISISPICEEFDEDGDPCYRPISAFSIEMKLKKPIQLENKTILNTVWERQKFVETDCEDSECILKTVKSFNKMLRAFKRDYKRSNPDTGAQFYLF